MASQLKGKSEARTEPPPPQQCTALLSSGTPCPQPAVRDGRCPLHGGASVDRGEAGAALRSPRLFGQTRPRLTPTDPRGGSTSARLIIDGRDHTWWTRPLAGIPVGRAMRPSEPTEIPDQELARLSNLIRERQTDADDPDEDDALIDPDATLRIKSRVDAESDLPARRSGRPAGNFLARQVAMIFTVALALAVGTLLYESLTTRSDALSAIFQALTSSPRTTPNAVGGAAPVTAPAP